jgi:hypothetical protein
MTKLELFKRATSVIVASGTSVIVGQIIARNTAPTTRVQTVTIPVTAFVIGALLAEKVSEFTDRQIDEVAAFYNESIKPAFRK